MDVRPGYKQTEVGVIPQDWGAQTIDDIAFVTSGKRLPLGSSLVEHPTPHPYIRVTDMRPGSVDLSEIRYVPETVFPAIKRYRIFSADIFISVAGSLGIVGKVPRVLDGANLTENADRITNIKCSQDFLLHVLMSPLIQNVIASIQTVGAQPKLALTRLRKFVVPQPPLPEQRAIATALSDVDALLTGLDRLITKKRDLKQAAMQQLLTGKIRLPGFPNEWERFQLHEIALTLKGHGLSRSVRSPAGALPCLLYGELFTSYGRVISDVLSRTDSCEGIASVKGDVLMPGSTTTSGVDLATASALLLDDVALGGDINIIRSKSDRYDPRFMANYLAEVKRKDIVERAQGITIHHLYGRDLLSLQLELPPREEQAAIADAISDMDAELTGLEARRNKIRVLKQGMMQELLTGRTRLLGAQQVESTLC